MKDTRLTGMKWRAEADANLTHPTARLLARLLTSKIRSPHFNADESFPLPWSEAARFVWGGERQSYDHVDELEEAGYLFRVCIKGCPPTRWFKFSF